MGCARYGQSPNQAERQEQKSDRANQSIGGQDSWGKGMSFLEDDLDTGEGLPNNVSPLPTNKIPLVSTPQVSSPMAPPSSLRLPTYMLLFLIPFSFAAMRLPDCFLCARHICLPLGSAPTLSHYAEIQKYQISCFKQVVEIDGSWRDMANSVARPQCQFLIEQRGLSRLLENSSSIWASLRLLFRSRQLGRDRIPRPVLSLK